MKGKKLGVRAGVPDILIHSHRVAIELKHGKNPASDEQIAWMDTGRICGRLLL